MRSVFFCNTTTDHVFLSLTMFYALTVYCLTKRYNQFHVCYTILAPYKGQYLYIYIYILHDTGREQCGNSNSKKTKKKQFIF